MATGSFLLELRQGGVSIMKMTKHTMSKLPPGLNMRGGVWHLRIGIPGNIRDTYPPTRSGKPATDAYRGSLGTSDRAAAIVLAHAKIAEVRQEFADRLALKQAKIAPPLVPITPELVAFVNASVVRQVLATDDVLRTEPHAAEAFVAPLRFLGHMDPAADFLDRTQASVLQGMQGQIARSLARDAARGYLGAAQRIADPILAGIGVRVDWSQPGGRIALLGILRELARAWTSAASRGDGGLVATPAPPVAPVVAALPDSSGPSLRDIVPEWKALSRAKSNAVQRMERALALFEEAVGVLPLARLDRGVGGRFLAFLLDSEARKFGDSTAANQTAAINALVNVAVKVGKLSANPFDLSFEVKGAEKREAWTTAELRTIFGSALFREDPAKFPTLRATEASAGYFILAMLLYSGARIGELAQLEVADVQDRGGIWAYEIHNRVGTVKTDESARWVPIHSHLVRLGLLEYHASLKRAGTAKLFPSLHRGKEAPASNATKWFAAFRKLVGLPSGRLEGSHKFRHLVRTTLDELGVGQGVADALTGHAATGSSGRTVYTNARLPAVAEAVGRLDFDLDLPRVWQHGPESDRLRV